MDPSEIASKIAGGAGFASVEKFGLGIIALFGTLVLLGWQVVASSTIWSEHNSKIKLDKDDPKYRGSGKPHRFIMPTIIIILGLIVVCGSSIILRFFYGFVKLGPTRLIAIGLLVGLLILNLWLRARYTGELVMVDDDTARCPGGTTMKKSAANNCKLELRNCPDIKKCDALSGKEKATCMQNITKMKSVWSWWEIPTLAIGGSAVFVGWLIYTFATLKTRGKNL